ncbi:MAG: hypothetical protein M5U28_03345 [Sandaracinaceae bacterium]|nr:hypothetical protein [Sandaracinaceae bacterium]
MVLHALDAASDRHGGDHELLQEALEVVDELLLVEEEGLLVAGMQVDAAPQPAEEDLGLCGQILEAAAELIEGLVHLAAVELLAPGKSLELGQEVANVRQRRGLQLAWLLDRALVLPERRARRPRPRASW